jgi:A/G-specific adenine glycosylase
MCEKMNGQLDKKAAGQLLSWYRENGRDLPWRRDTEPYHVWVSEIMLQQTRISAVLGYYERFMQELPDIPSLAAVPEERLLKLWEGLGYYSRARNLKAAAEVMVKEYGGKFPKTAEEIRCLPGIGPYTAGAIGSICFNLPTPAVDGNVLRVITRLTADDSCIDEDAIKKRITGELTVLYEALKRKECGPFTQALMELGQVICVPKGEPACMDCPLNTVCRAYVEGTETEYPVKKKKAERRKEEKTVLLLIDASGTDYRIAVHKRGEKGLLSGLWEFPNLPGKRDVCEVTDRLEINGFKKVTPRMELPHIHIFSHVEWHMEGIFLEVSGSGEELPDKLSEIGEIRWISRAELEEEFAIPSAFAPYRNMLGKLYAENGQE